MHTRRRSRAPRALLFALLLVAGGCASTTVSGPSSAERIAYLTARARWEERGVVRYSWVFQRGWCECLPEWTRAMYVEVDGPAEVRVYDAVTREPITDGRSSAEPPTVAYVFDVIADAIARNAYRLRVEYHPVYGHPTLVDVDYHRTMVDDEFRIETRELVVRQ